MSPLKNETRLAIRHLYFVNQISIVEIAETLGVTVRTVRRALVIAGGASPERRTGPYGKETDS